MMIDQLVPIWSKEVLYKPEIWSWIKIGDVGKEKLVFLFFRDLLC